MNSFWNRTLRRVGRTLGRTDPAPAVTHAKVYDVGRRGLPPLRYAPHPDDLADPGEVVWTWVPYEEDPDQGKDRPVLVLARTGSQALVLQMTSKDHDRDADQEARYGRHWMDIGSGEWDSRHRASEVRLDRLLQVPLAAVRRTGGALDERRYDQVVAELRKYHS